VNFFLAAFEFITDPAQWAGDRGIGARLVSHLVYTGLGVGFAAIIAIPLGLYIGHTGRWRGAVITLTGAARAIPTLGLVLFIVYFAGLGLEPLIIVLAILAIPPLLAGVYAGLEAVDRQPIDGARAMGMTEWQILTKVEIPLALPLILGGLRSAALQVIATATVAGYVGLQGLGRFLIEGLALHRYDLAVAGAVLVAGLALVVDGVLALVQRLVVPRGVPRGSIRRTRRRPTRPSRPAAPITEG
jgi:osmoprotectant transport system permease protein